MKAKKIAAVSLAATLLVGALAGCDQAPISVGNGASTITVDRGEYLALKNGVTTQDISSVIDYIENLEAVVGDIGDYTTSYDKDTHTVYATTDTGNLAFYLDANGNVVFASANGTTETKEQLYQGIVRVSIGNYLANQVSGVLNQVEQTKWLNSINANVVAAEIGGTGFTQLDMSLMYFETPALESLMASDLERDIYGVGEVTMPVLTDSLAEYGIQDLTNYYESPTLVKYWSGVDLSNMEASINAIVEDGISLGNSYASAKLDSPDLEVPEWSLTSYTLPMTFSDGTSTGNLGEQTLSAYEGFSSALNNWKSDLLAQEEQAQLDGWGDIAAANQSGLDSVTSTINNNSTAFQQQATTNQNSISDRTQSAFGSVTDKNVAAGAATDQKTNDAFDSANAQTNSAGNKVSSQAAANQAAVNQAQAAGEKETQDKEGPNGLLREEDNEQLSNFKKDEYQAATDAMTIVETQLGAILDMKEKTDGIIQTEQGQSAIMHIAGGNNDIPNGSDTINQTLKDAGIINDDSNNTSIGPNTTNSSGGTKPSASTNHRTAGLG